MTVDHGGKARVLLALHQGPRTLVLPNIWDPLGARMLEALGYPAVATDRWRWRSRSVTTTARAYRSTQ